MDSWPSGLPQQLKIGASLGDDDSRLTSAMDSGPASVRNRFTAFTQSVQTPMIITGAQLVIFKTFYRTTLVHGSLSFEWTDPSDDSTVTYRFKKPPKWSSVRSGVPDVRLWQGILDLEIQP